MSNSAGTHDLRSGCLHLGVSDDVINKPFAHKSETSAGDELVCAGGSRGAKLQGPGAQDLSSMSER